MWMMKNGKYSFDFKKLGFCHGMCQKLTAEMIERNNTVIVSNTTLRRKDLDVYINIAERYNYPVEIIVMKENFVSVHNVPEDKIKLMEKQLESFDWRGLPDFVSVKK